MFDAAAPSVQPLMRALAESGAPPPDDIGLDLAVGGRVITTVELSWTARHVCVALPEQAPADRRAALERAGWRVIVAEPAQLTEAAEAVRTALAASASTASTAPNATPNATQEGNA